MGFRVSSLHNLPVHFGCYFFVIGDTRIGGNITNLFKEFDVIADRIGHNAAYVVETDKSSLIDELDRRIYKVRESKSEFAKFLESCENRMPGLLITRKHPDKLSIDDEITFIPFQIIEETYKNSIELMKDLYDFAEGNNQNLIKKAKNKFLIHKHLAIGLNVGIFAINYNI